MDRGICHNCIGDDYLEVELSQRAQIIACSECGAEAAGIPLKELAQRLERHLRGPYRVGGEYLSFDESSGYRGRLTQAGDSLSETIQDRLGHRFSAHVGIVVAVRSLD